MSDDPSVWKRGRDHRIEALKLNCHEVPDGLRSILIIAYEILTWRVKSNNKPEDRVE